MHNEKGNKKVKKGKFINNSKIVRTLVRYHSHNVPLTSRLAFSSISQLFADQFKRSLRFCYLEFDKEAISDGRRSKKARYRW